MRKPCKKKCTAIAIAAFACAFGSAAAVAGGHYVGGVEGMDASAVPPPGFYYLGYLVHYDIRSFRAPDSSSSLPGRNKGDVSVLDNRFVWITNHKLLGADYGMDFHVPIQHTSLRLGAIGARDAHTSVGDMLFEPLILGWHGAQWDAVAAAGVWFDNASSNRLAAAGKGYKTLMLTGGVNYYFDQAKSTSFNALGRYEFNGKNNGTRPGQQFTLEWALGRMFGPVKLGVVGYDQWQTTRDRGQLAGNGKESRHAAGLEVMYPIPSAKMALKAAVYKEYSVDGGSGPAPKGTFLRATLVKAF